MIIDIVIRPAATSSFASPALQAYWQTQPRAVRILTPELEVCWDNTPGRLERYPLFHDAAGRVVAIPPPGPARIAWPVARVLARGKRCSRNYWLGGGTGSEPGCYRMQAYPLAPVGDAAPLIVEEIELVDKAQCHDERLRQLDDQLTAMMATVAGFLTHPDAADFLRLRLANPNLQPCHQIKQCRRKACPGHGREDFRCWEVPDTLCPDEAPRQDPLTKFEYCSRCEVYLLACPDPLTRIGENFNRLLSFLQMKYQESLEMHRQVQQSEKLAALGELTLGIVHEIKNPLSVIASRLDCLGLEMDSLTGTELANDLAVLRGQIGRMQQFLKDLLGFSRPGEVELRPVDLNRVICNTIPLLGKTLEKGDLRIESKLPRGLPAVLGDPVSIQQILLNLIMNARDASPDGGTIRIRTRVNPREVGEVMVEVRDEGQGIGPGEIKRIFSPFYSTKGDGGGTGLGLTICNRIMEQHGGRITASSRPRQGSTFTLYFKRLNA